jgi:chromosome segregation ATPase
MDSKQAREWLNQQADNFEMVGKEKLYPQYRQIANLIESLAAKADELRLKLIDQQLKLQTRDLELDGLKDTLQIAINNGDNWQESWRKAKDKLAARETELETAKFKLNNLADAYKEIEHKNKLLNMALSAANSKSLDDYCPYYAYDPDRDTEQLKSLCHGVTVHIPVDWLNELLADKVKPNA